MPSAKTFTQPSECLKRPQSATRLHGNLKPTLKSLTSTLWLCGLIWLAYKKDMNLKRDLNVIRLDNAYNTRPLSTQEYVTAE
ncbi:hypothetical protein RRG08_028797 [Elysia crispata]|uniref:Uncharacterized protein n=1 Tax=Elysia crispata TaxID=231223 RepID=A0AAE0XT22_9GAST|nr:hypothetical protein RRG08_028797 [Elysia crispata]